MGSNTTLTIFVVCSSLILHKGKDMAFKEVSLTISGNPDELYVYSHAPNTMENALLSAVEYEKFSGTYAQA